MSKSNRQNRQLTRSFFGRPTVQVARELLGKRLVRLETDGTRVSGFIVETEAYCGTDDLGCHAKAGKTKRNRPMWEHPGYAYVYFNYGMHWLLNFVTEEYGFPAAVLIRGLMPAEGLDKIQQRRKGRPEPEWTNGPAKLAQALGIDANHNGCDICSPDSSLFVESCPDVPEELVNRGPRIGLFSVPEPWKSTPWRFWIPGNSTVARSYRECPRVIVDN